MERTVGAVYEASSTEKDNRISNGSNSQLYDLLAAYDMHELTTKMADLEDKRTTSSHEEGTSTQSNEEEKQQIVEKEEKVATSENDTLEKNGDHVEKLDVNCVGGFISSIEKIPQDIPESSKKSVLSKVKRDRRKRPPSKSILKPSYSRDSFLTTQSPTRFGSTGNTFVTTDSMVQSIPNLFRSASTTNFDERISNFQRATCKQSKEYKIVNSNVGVMEQIQQSVLPTFCSPVGPPSRLKLPIPETGYVCPDCLDHFWLESSFAQHVQRRSVYINFFCHFCCKLLVFYNRCALLGHARIHRERQQACDVSSATLAPLDKDLIPCAHESKASTLSTIATEKNESRNSKKKHKESATIFSKPITEIANVLPTKSVSQTCSECQHKCKNVIELAEHFGENREVPPSTDSECSQCHMICTSRCSLASHQRTHAKTHPYVCPECGQKVSESWQEFKNHVTESCMHHSRMLGFRCPTCGILSVNPEHLKGHVSTDHKVILYKCDSCPKAFKSVKSFEGHRRAVHSENKTPAKYSLIQQCPVCDCVIHQQNLLIKHLDLHFQEIFAAAKYVFRCLECGLLSETKADLSTHLKNNHSYATNSEKKQNKPPKKKLKQSPSDGVVVNTKMDETLATCDHCNRAFRTSLGLNVHRFRSHGIRINHNQTTTVDLTEETSANADKPPPITIKFKKKKKSLNNDNYTLSSPVFDHSRVSVNGEANLMEVEDDLNPKCKLCYDEFPNRRTLMEHGNLHLQEGFLVCMLCSNLTFTNKIALSRHLEKHSLSSTYPLNCIYCQAALSHRTQAAVHWREEHGLSSYQCPHCETRYLYHKSLSRHIREVHRGFKKATKADNDASASQNHFLGADVHENEKTLENRCSKPSLCETEHRFSEAKQTQNDQHDTMESDENEVPVPETDASASDVKVKSESGANCEEDQVEYRCSKCEFQSQTRPVFLRHILKHKAEIDEAFQCLECGTCFVVEPSLHKHLKLVHKIKHLDSYLNMIKLAEEVHEVELERDAVNNNNCLDSCDSNGDLDSGITCNICRQSFENEQMLKTHSRSHGMAFLQAASKRSVSGYASDASSPCSTPTK